MNSELQAGDGARDGLPEATGSVIVFNGSPAPMTAISALVSGQSLQIFSSSQGIPPASGASPWVSGARIQRGAGPGLFPDSSQISVYFDGDTNPTWTYVLTLPNAQPWQTFYLWLFVNGYILGDQSGNLRSASWQAPVLCMSLSDRNLQENPT
jgi:hypothetical protein